MRNAAIVTGVALLYRLLFLGERQLWTDELMQALVLRSSMDGSFFEVLRTGLILPSPLSLLVQKAVVTLLGEANWSQRLHAAIFGAASVWLFFRIARLWFVERTALYCSVLFAFLPLHYHYSQDARPYALLVLLTLAAYDLAFRLLREDRLWGWILLGILFVLIVHTSFWGILVIAALLGGFLLRVVRPVAATIPEASASSRPFLGLASSGRLQLTLAAGCAVLALLSVLPWAQFAWSGSIPQGEPYFPGPRTGARLLKELGDNSFLMTALLLAGGVAGILALRQHKRADVLMWMGTWCLVPLFGAVILDALCGIPFEIVHILPAVPPLVLLAGYGLSYVGERMTILDQLPYKLSAPAIAYISVTIVISVVISATHWRRELVDWEGAAGFLREQLREGDRLHAPEIHALLEYHQPDLGRYRSEEISPPDEGNPVRQFVACFQGMTPDPCASFRSGAGREPGWRRVERSGFTIYAREK